jgi:protease I
MYKPESDNASSGRVILMVTANDTEDLEFFYPYYRFIEAGFKVDVATPKGGEFKAKHGLGLKESKKISDTNPAHYELLYIPGGKAPAALKEDKDAVSLVQKYVATGKPVVSICHGPQLLAKADVIKGRKIAAWPEVEAEVKAAGAAYVNQETMVDGQFTTARWPGDLPAQMKLVIQALNKTSKSQSELKLAV